MLNINIDLKTIFILILGGALVLSLLFRPSVPIEEYENEINILKKKNKELLISNDSIVALNKKLEEEIQQILFTIDSTEALLRNTEIKLKELERKREELLNSQKEEAIIEEKIELEDDDFDLDIDSYISFSKMYI